MSKRPFRTLPKNSPEFIQWLDRVQKAKGEHWKDLGIFDFIQLFHHPLSFNPSMLGPFFYFRNKTTNTFQLPYGMITPTLLELAAITDLRPTGKLIHFNPVLDYVKAYNLDDSEASYSAVIHNNMGSPSTTVSDAEHVAFLSYWLNAVEFCSRSLQMQQRYYALAIMLHEGHRLSLSKLIIAQLYEEMSSIVTKLQHNHPINPGDPMWFLQLWAKHYLRIFPS